MLLKHGYGMNPTIPSCQSPLRIEVVKREKCLFRLFFSAFFRDLSFLPVKKAILPQKKKRKKWQHFQYATEIWINCFFTNC